MIKFILVAIGIILILVGTKFFWLEAIGVFIIIGALIFPKRKKQFRKLNK